jgi:hypothetical protein
MKRLAFLAVVACLWGGALPGTGRAEFIITFTQNGANVDATGSGRLNIAALAFNHSDTGNPFVQGTFAIVQLGASGGPLDDYTGFTGPSSIGPGGPFPASSGTGPIVGILDVPSIAQFVVTPQGYISGTSITSSATWDNATISSLGLAPGTYEWTWGSGATADDLQVVIPGAAVPEPASLTLSGLGAAGLLGYGWRRRKRAV